MRPALVLVACFPVLAAADLLAAAVYSGDVGRQADAVPVAELRDERPHHRVVVHEPDRGHRVAARQEPLVPPAVVAERVMH